MSGPINPLMRLFNGHLKLNEETLTDLFIQQLDNIYSSKAYLVRSLPQLVEKASFGELKTAIIQGIDDINLQLLRMDVIYQTFGMEYDEVRCMGTQSINVEAYLASQVINRSPLLVDMSILTHLRIIEGIEIISFNILEDIAAALNNPDIQTMVNQNLQAAINSSKIYELISKEYIS